MLRSKLRTDLKIHNKLIKSILSDFIPKLRILAILILKMSKHNPQ